MNKNSKRLPIWLTLAIGSLLLLTACSAALSSTGLAVVDEGQQTSEIVDEVLAEEIQSSYDDDVEKTERGPSESAEPNNREDANNVIILTEDDRSDRLRSLTRTWNTNWNKHTVSYDELLSGGPPRDGIRSIDEPNFIDSEEASAWLADNEPVIALDLNGDARAYPLQIITWHEIVNDTVGDIPVVVTFCPLCNSALVFDRRVDSEVFEFGVSGLLRNSDLIIYDRTTETLWQQFTGDAIVGDLAGTRLTFLPSSIVSFADFRSAHPEGLILSRDTGRNAPYGRNPYAGYDTYQHILSAGGNLALFQGDLDTRLAPNDRVVTVSLDVIAIDLAYPVDILAQVGVINDSVGGEGKARDLAVFFKNGTASALGADIIAEAEDVGATGVFDPVLDGQKLTFKSDGDLIIDNETGTTWNILGQAIDGPLAGQTLSPIVHGDHFWFSWAAFKPDTIIYQG